MVFVKLENFLNEKIRAAPPAAAPHMCISSELLPLFLFYLAASQGAAQVYNGLNTVIKYIVSTDIGLMDKLIKIYTEEE